MRELGGRRRHRLPMACEKHPPKLPPEFEIAEAVAWMKPSVIRESVRQSRNPRMTLRFIQAPPACIMMLPAVSFWQ